MVFTFNLTFVARAKPTSATRNKQHCGMKKRKNQRLFVRLDSFIQCVVLKCRPSFEHDSFNIYVIYHFVSYTRFHLLTSLLPFVFHEDDEECAAAAASASAPPSLCWSLFLYTFVVLFIYFYV